MADGATTPPSSSPSRIIALNERIAARGTTVFGSMWAFYVFFVWGLLAFVPQLKQYKDTILLISSAWIQLWALPLLMVGGIVLNRASEKRAEEDHETIRQEFEIVKEHQHALHQEILQAKKTRHDMHELAKLIPDIVERLNRIEAALGQGSPGWRPPA